MQINMQLGSLQTFILILTVFQSLIFIKSVLYSIFPYKEKGYYIAGISEEKLLHVWRKAALKHTSTAFRISCPFHKFIK